MVEIIPKEVPKIPTFLNILFYLSVVLLMISLIGFFVLNNSLSNSRERLTTLSAALLASENDPEKISLEKEINSYQKQISSFALLFNQHKATSKIFELLEKNTHPNVWFKSLNLTVADGHLGLAGEAKDFKSLGQQMIILNDEVSFKNVALSNIFISEGGKINFSLSISFDPEILIKI